MDKRLGTLDLDETIVIDGEVHITILDIQGGQVRFGITAPAVVKVYCQVLLERIWSNSPGNN